MYNNLLEAAEEEYIWDENTLLFRNREAEIRDRLGSPIDMDEFGAVTVASVLGFTGYMYDDVSGTYFAQAREYMPEVGRFTGRDIVKGTILQPLTLNNYHYCYSNPSKFADFDGKLPKPIQDYFDERDSHYNRNKEQDMYIENYPGGDSRLISDIQEGKDGWEQLAPPINKGIGKAMGKGRLHRFPTFDQGLIDPFYNAKYVKELEDGSSYEIVICERPGRTAYIVRNAVNMGTQNKYNPTTPYRGKMHGKTDVLEYLYWNNAENLPSVEKVLLASNKYFSLAFIALRLVHSYEKTEDKSRLSLD